MMTLQSSSGGLGVDPISLTTGILTIFGIMPSQQPAAAVPPPTPPKTGWAALSTGTKVAVVGGGAAVLGLVAYLALRR